MFATLFEIIKRSWDSIGQNDLYDKYITNTKNRLVLRYVIFERDFLDKVILDSDEPIVLIEIGCGTGRLLSQYVDFESKIFPKKRSQKKIAALSKKVIKVIGIDYSKSMLKRLKTNLGSYYRDVIIINCDASNLSSFLPQIIEDNDLSMHKKVFACMLGTFGNMDHATRNKIIIQLKKIMRSGDVFVLSVWDNTNFKAGISMYKKFEGLIGKFNNTDIDELDSEIQTKNNYYIKWFAKKKLIKFLHDEGFKIADTCPQTTDFFFAIKATI